MQGPVFERFLFGFKAVGGGSEDLAAEGDGTGGGAAVALQKDAFGYAGAPGPPRARLLPVPSPEMSNLNFWDEIHHPKCPHDRNSSPKMSK